ncbi:MAG: squalene cyclase, partial [Verrucomicrobiales bacterium]
ADAKTATEQLLSLQAENGGWAQQPGMDAEAYSTGSALAALLATNSIDSKHPACEAAISFLLEAQLEDGSWKIETRSRPIQKHYESGFPHGKDQFISCAGSCWAVLALLRAIE